MKVLIIGGAHQGKSEYARKKYRREPDMKSLHLMVRSLIQEGKDPRANVLSMLEQCSEWLVTCDEIGCGIVPIEKTDRRWREQTGRLLCELAQCADIVERVSCGIGLVLKGG